MDIRYYLKTKGFQWNEVQRPKGLTAVMNCKFCDDKEKKFAVSLVDGAFSCLHLNSCGVKGSFWDLQKMLGDKPVGLDNDTKFREVPKIKYVKPKIKPDALKDNGYKFLIDRGFTQDTIKKFKIGQKDGALMFPIFKDGVHVSTKFRSLNEKKFWNETGTAPYLFNRDNCSGKRLAICEGFEDCMALDQYGIPAASVPNGTGDDRWIEQEWDFLDKFKKIYLFFDNDDAGQDAVDKIVNRIGKWRCHNVLLPYKDANECLSQGVAKETIKECVENAIEYDLAILKKAEYFREKTKEFNRKKEKKYGYETGMKKLTNIVKGWREGELTVIYGHNGAGKSTWMSQEILHQIGNGFRVCLCSLELPAASLFTWMGSQYMKKESLTDVDFDEAFDFFGDNILLLNRTGQMGIESILDAFTYAARKYGVKFFIIDNMMQVKLDKRYELYEQKNLLEMSKGFSIDNECHVFILAHPRKTITDNARPNKNDILGSSNIGNLCDNIIAIWRDREDEFIDGEMIVQKNRFYGDEETVQMFFDKRTKLFLEVE